MAAAVHAVPAITEKYVIPMVYALPVEVVETAETFRLKASAKASRLNIVPSRNLSK